MRYRCKNQVSLEIILTVVLGCLSVRPNIIRSNELYQKSSIDESHYGYIVLNYNMSNIPTIQPYCTIMWNHTQCYRSISCACSEKDISFRFDNFYEISAMLSQFKNISEYILSIHITLRSGSCAHLPSNLFETFAVIPKLTIYSELTEFSFTVLPKYLPRYRDCNNFPTFVPNIPILTLRIFGFVKDLSDLFLAQFTSVSNLVISWNPMEYVNAKAFLNLLNLRTLELTNNKLKAIPSFQFESSTVFSNLHSLNLNNNQLTSLEAYCFLGLHELHSLSLVENKIGIIHSETFEGLRKLEHLDLTGNKIFIWPDFVFSPLVSLRVLILSRMNLCDSFKISGVDSRRYGYDYYDMPNQYQINAKSFINLTSLIALELDQNMLFQAPVCKYDDIALFPNLQVLTLNQMTESFGILTTEVGPCFSNLQKLSIKNSLMVGFALSNAFASLTSLLQIDFTETKMKLVEGHSLVSDSLIELILSNVQVDNICSDVFEYAPALNLINLTNIRIDKILINKKTNPDSQMKISDWNGLTFRNLMNLTTLDLSGHGRKIISLREETFTHSTSIRYLYLRNIDIKFVKYESLPIELWTNLIELDLSDNPFVCDCELVWFRRWLKQISLNTTNTTVLRLTDPTAYTCAYPVEDLGKSILGYSGSLTALNELRCFSNSGRDDWILLTEFMSLIFVGILSLFISLLYRYRWHVRYWHFVVKAKRQQEYDILDEHQYEYDAFVMYSQQDSAWVIHELRPYLETEEHLHLCLHHRDFLGGRDIVENIVDGIEGSRKCLLIVSNAFAESNWCQFEMTMAQTSSIRADRRKVILVLLEEIAEINMTPRLRLQMAEQTYIEWTSNIISQQLFWKQLARAIKKPTSSVVQSQPF